MTNEKSMTNEKLLSHERSVGNEGLSANEKIYKISKHAKERYAERILGKESQNEIQSFVVQNEEKIQIDINKMITYGTLIYSGKQQKGGLVNVYCMNCWIILADPSNETVITLYKVDLGCGEDFNREYVGKMIDRITEAREKLEQIKTDTSNESDMYRSMMMENNEQITQYRGYIKNLEGLNAAYEGILKNNTVKVSQADRNVADLVNALISKKEF